MYTNLPSIMPVVSAYSTIFPSLALCGPAAQAARITAAINMMAKNFADPSMSYSLLFDFVDDRVL
jgi:hypothetical protein